MIYFEHYLREAGVSSLSTVVILGPCDGDSVCGDVAAEILDLFPGASVGVVAGPEPAPACDLVVSIFRAPWRFPFHDVVYEGLDQLDGLLRQAAAARSVMIYGASWRSVEVVASDALPAWVARRRREARWIRLLERSSFLRRLLRPLYT